MAGVQIETTSIGGRTYTIDALREHMDSIPTQELPLDVVRAAVGPQHAYWIDRNGNTLAPFQILQDWENAQKVEAWADHVESIRRADLTRPIWITPNGAVFDGVHRLIRAVLENKPTILVQIATDLPAVP